MLAGLHSNSTHYVGDLICKAIPPDSSTIASQLRNTGFTTLATVTNPHLSVDRNFDIGFEHYQNLRLKTDSSMVEKRTDTDEGILDRLENFFDSRLSDQKSYPNPYILPYIIYRYQQLDDWPTVNGADVRKQLVSQLDNFADTESPTFAWCHFNDIHAPIHPRKEPKVHDVGGTVRQLSADSARVAGIEHERCSKRYDNALRYVDSQIEYLFDDLRELEMLDDTAVIIVGDHGEELGKRNVYSHPWHYMYDVLLHVPLLIWTSDENTNKRLSSPFSLAWLHEIISELSATDLGTFPTECSGRPFEDEYQGPVVSDSVSPYGYSIAVRDGEQKYLDYRTSDVPYWTHQDVFSQEDLICLNISGTTDEDSAEIGSVDDGITDLIDNHYIGPEQLSELSDDLTENAEHRLQQLGYLE
jgi:hypothetical protein